MTTTIEKLEIVCDPQVGNHWCIQKFTLCLRWREAKRKTQKCKSAFMPPTKVWSLFCDPVDIHSGRLCPSVTVRNLPKMKRDDRKEIEEERFDMSAGTRLENYCAKYSTQAPHLFHTLQLQFSSRFRVGTHRHCDVSLSRIYIDAINMSSLTWPIIAFKKRGFALTIF